MNHNHIGMDRTEQSGLAAAVIIHLALAAALWFGMQSVPEPVIKPEAISVSLIGEIAPVSTAPDAAAETAPNAETEAAQPAPPADAAPEAPAPTPALPPKPLPKVDVKPVSAPKVTPPKIIPPKPPIKAQPKAVVKTVPKKIEKPAKSEPVKKPATAAKAATKPTAKPTAKPIKSGGFGKGFEERIAGVGGSSSATPAAAKAPGAGTAIGTPASKSGAEVRRSVTTALAGQIRPFLQSCAPSGVDVDKISTFITVNLAIDGDVTSVAFDKQTGINESNRPQADPLRQCAVKAAKQAAPYRGLDPEYHDLWRSHKLQLKAR